MISRIKYAYLGAIGLPILLLPLAMIDSPSIFSVMLLTVISSPIGFIFSISWSDAKRGFNRPALITRSVTASFVYIVLFIATAYLFEISSIQFLRYRGWILIVSILPCIIAIVTEPIRKEQEQTRPANETTRKAWAIAACVYLIVLSAVYLKANPPALFLTKGAEAPPTGPERSVNTGTEKSRDRSRNIRMLMTSTMKTSRDVLYPDIPHGTTDTLFTDGKLTSCPKDMMLELIVSLESDCFRPFTGKDCSALTNDIKLVLEGDSPVYDLTSSGTLTKQNVFVPNEMGAFAAYVPVGSHYSDGASGCSALQPSVSIRAFKNAVEIGSARLPDPRSSYLGFQLEGDLRKGLDKEINFIARLKGPFEIGVYLEEIPDQDERVKKYLEMHPDSHLACNNGMVPCSVRGDYDADGRQDILFTIRKADDPKNRFVAAMGSGASIPFEPCDGGLWKTVKENNRDVVFIDDVERSSCRLKWTGTTMWGPPGEGD